MSTSSPAAAAAAAATRDDRTALVRDDGETWSLVQDASGTGLLLAGAVLALAALLTVPILDGAPYFAALQLVALVGVAGMMLDEREEVTVRRRQGTMTLERSLLGCRRRVVPLRLADVADVVIESFQGGLMRRPRYQLAVRLDTGVVVPLLGTFTLAKPDDVAAQLRAAIGLPADTDAVGPVGPAAEEDDRAAPPPDDHDRAAALPGDDRAADDMVHVAGSRTDPASRRQPRRRHVASGV